MRPSFSAPVCLESLKAALARGPVVAGEVRAAFEKQRGADGTELYRMLWGYTAEQFKDGSKQVVVSPRSLASGDLIVPYAGAP